MTRLVPTITRRIEFDAAHRITQHGSKCRHLHGHRYRFEVTVGAKRLDALGMIIDFGAVKRLVGGWIDEHLDHAFIANQADASGLIALCRAAGWTVFEMDGEPTAENLAVLLKAQAARLLADEGITVERVRLYETPNCWADA